MSKEIIKRCCVLAGMIIVLGGCRMEIGYESAQLKEYIDFIRDETTRSLPDDMLALSSGGLVQEYQSKYSVIFTDDKYISFHAEEYYYIGGAHGSNKITVGTIDRKTGRRLRLKDFVPAHNLSVLTEILHEKVVKKLGGKDKLLGEVLPIENFCVVKEGLKFVYNEYEVACYAAGAVEVVVSFAEIGKL